MSRRGAGLALVSLVVAACGADAQGIPVGSGPDLPGAEIVSSEGIVEESGGEGGDEVTSEAIVTTEVRFGPQFFNPTDGTGRLAVRLAEFELGPLLTTVTSDPNVMTTITNTGDEAVTGIALESSFAIDGGPRSDVVVSAESDGGACAADGATVSCAIGTLDAGGAVSALVRVRGEALLDGTVTVTTRLLAAVQDEPTAGPGDTPVTPGEQAT